MTFRQLALSNIRGHALRYSAFFLSSTFSVMLFFVYAQFVFHPDVATGYIYGGDSSRTVLATCLVLIGVFAFFFVLYSSGAFLRSRNQEFGLLTLMGTTRSQLRRLVWAENTFISLAAITTGVLFGLLFSRLFLLGISRVLGVAEPLRFALVPQALVFTIAGFFLLFQVVTLVSSVSIGRRRIIELLRAARKPRAEPRPRPLLAALGFLLIIGGYAWAITGDQMMVVIAFLPVTAMTVIGTYLLVGQGSIIVLNWLRSRQGSYLQGTRMITVSQLVFRLHDNSRLLSTIAALSAVVLAGAGTFYSFSSLVNSNVRAVMPQQFALLEPAGADAADLSAAEAEAIIGDHPAAAPGMAVRATAIESRLDGVWMVMWPESDVLKMQAAGIDITLASETVSANVAGEVLESAEAGQLELRALMATGVSRPGWLTEGWYLVPDGQWQTVIGQFGTVGTYLLYDWPQSPAGNELSAALHAAASTDNANYYVNNRQAELGAMRAVLGLSLFAGLFISLLFFIGSASLIYFKLFTELPDDRATYRRLGRIGMTWAETARTVTAQVGLVFLLPFALGAVHALVALRALGTLLMTDVTVYSLAVVALFAAVQLGFFILTRWTYLRALRPAAIV